MEAEELTVGRVHHGHNIRRFRIEKNMNQEVLSQLVHLSQSAVSKYEQMLSLIHISEPTRPY